MDILSIENLSKQYKDKLAINNLTYSLSEGRILGLLGPNGSGKTTLLKCIAGLLTPEKGRITICENPIGVETKKLVA